MEKYTQTELKAILALHKKWLNDEHGGACANLRGANLRCADLRGADLRGADLRCANLRGANLIGADLRGADLRGADLIGTNLRGADLRGANLRCAKLIGADLSYLNLIGARLIGANLRGADLRGTVGEMKYIKSLQCGEYFISYTYEKINIGCQSHTIEEWQNFDNETIAEMDDGALEWWQKWKPILMNLIEISPALETELNAERF